LKGGAKPMEVAAELGISRASVYRIIGAAETAAESAIAA
jgi:predicted transcriptional regulator YheO